jgi:hypothetical protein
MLKRPPIVMALIWAFSWTIWIPVTLHFETKPYSLEVDYKPMFLQKIFKTLLWFLPLVFIFVLSVQIVWLLNKRSLRKLYLSRKLVNTTNNAVSVMNESAAMGPAGKSSNTGVESKTGLSLRKKKKITLQPQNRYMLISKFTNILFNQLLK